MHLEAVALEDDLRSGEVGDPLKRRLHLRRVDGCRRHEDIERDGKEPERGDVELTDLSETKRKGEKLSDAFESRTKRVNGMRKTHQSHDASNRPLDVDSLISVDADETRLASDDGEGDEGRVVGHDGLQLLESFGDEPVELPREDRRISRDDTLALIETRERTNKAGQQTRKRRENETMTRRVERRSNTKGKETILTRTLCIETWKSISFAL